MFEYEINALEQLSVKQIIDCSKPLTKPLAFSLDTQHLRLTSSIVATERTPVAKIDDIQPLEQTSATLVVFSTLKLATLVKLQDCCQLNLMNIEQINQRNGLTSIRFGITCQDISFSRQLLASFNIQHNIEAAITQHSPSLSQPGLLVMDMDSTAIKIECIDEIAKLAGTGEQVAAVTAQAMRGELDFKQSLYQRVATLEGADEAILQTVLANLPLMEGLTELIATLQANHWRLAIASGGFTYFADHLKATLPLDDAFSNQLEIIDGKLTGKVLGEVVDANKKADVLVMLADKYQIPMSQTVAIGDGANDLVMMAKAQLGVACHAKEIVQQKAQTSINKAPLDTLLHWLD
ncbi:phosphoserine phosphatase SerB [Thalassotalea sp. LPB0316]|uniref:phosphoserine phosphatase SerB n=1 Tax=Thalassotalea sp. LPB0316 TaxID=2769490 RepID=UPI0018692887|nr:phosphoserine phosphatase SerB [Thalassotalea sp. LPB0316]QOL25518.1 phosphoserine phosphatase SerB [Thalassotalea sp. LPB0316]